MFITTVPNTPDIGKVRDLAWCVEDLNTIYYTTISLTFLGGSRVVARVVFLVSIFVCDLDSFIARHPVIDCRAVCL